MAKMSHHVIREMEDGNYTMEHHSAPKRIKGGMGYEHEEPKTHLMGSECEHCGRSIEARAVVLRKDAAAG